MARLPGWWVPGWRALGVTWLAAAGLTGLGAAALQAMGPAKPPLTASHVPAAATALPPAAVMLPGPAAPSRSAADPIPEPQAALLQPAPDFPGAMLPRIAADGQTSAQAYARLADPADKRPRVAMLVVGLGLSAADTHAAIEALPAAVSLGVSPYAHDAQGVVTEAHAHGHEVLVTLPMESQGYPLNQSGPHALMTGADPADNARNLEWVLSRMQGEVGVTGASDGLLGERFAETPAAFGPVLQDLAARGLLYVDPHPGAAAPGAAVAVSLVVDDPAERAALDAKLAALEQRARDNGAAVGLAGPLRPMTVERIASWARGLDGRGLALVPVSALASRPAAAPAPTASVPTASAR